MKTIVLAGGVGDRLWPLSRRNYPKQFIQFNNERSMFQDAITRNIPYTDEFIIVAGSEYREIIEGQLRQFQSINYVLCMEEVSLGTTVAIARGLNYIQDTDEVLIIPADLLVSGATYSNHIYDAKNKAKKGRICLFGIEPNSSTNSYSYIRYRGDTVTSFIAEPSIEMAKALFSEDLIYWNGGMVLSLASTLKNEINKFCPDVSTLSYTSTSEVTSFDKAVLAKSELLSVVRFDCEWIDISDFESYTQSIDASYDNIIKEDCDNVDVVNISSNQLVVANGVDNAYIVNTPDAIYVTAKDRADMIKDILKKNSNIANQYERSYIDNRPWGIREILKKEPGFRVRKITIFAGLKLSNHMHNRRSENYTVVSGILTIELSNEIIELKEGEAYNIEPNVMHMLRNNTDENVVVIEVDTGSEIYEWDMVHNDEIEHKSPVSIHDNAMPHIYKLKASYKDYLWGGDKLMSIYHKDTPYDITAESWELSAHQDGPSIIKTGPYAGYSFRDFIHKYKPLVCGWKSEVFDRFPILIKLIDATNSLSVQIHPDDDYAFVNEHEFGKNEMWYILDCEEDAYLYVGLKDDYDTDTIREHIHNKTLTDILNKVYVKKGDVIFVPAGTIHAIGKGILICEVQQNSNTTYRLYDYDRKDRDGRLRPLHINKAMEVVDTKKFYVDTSGVGDVIKYDRSVQRLLCQCKYFEVKHYDIPKHEIIMVDDSSFKAIVVIKGTCRISCQDEEYTADALDTFFIAAGRKRVHIYGQCELLAVNI